MKDGCMDSFGDVFVCFGVEYRVFGTLLVEGDGGISWEVDGRGSCLPGHVGGSGGCCI